MNTTNDSATDSTTLVAPDMTITKTHTGNFLLGQVGATYTVTATNSGTAATTGVPVSVTDVPPVGLTITAMAGTGWTCTTLPTCTRTDVLAASTSYPAITVTVTVAANATSPLLNVVNVAGGGEVNTSNDQATDSTTLVAPDMTITKTHTGNFIQGQVGATYTVTVTVIAG